VTHADRRDYWAGFFAGVDFDRYFRWVVGALIFLAGFAFGLVLDHMTVWVGGKFWPFG